MTTEATKKFCFERGAPTRRPKRGERRARRLQKMCTRMTGARMARFASIASAIAGRPDVSFEFDAESNLYLCKDGGTHAFAHPQRLWTLFDGRHARGNSLAISYLLDLIDFEPGDRIVDIGANAGDLVLGFDAIGCPIHYIGFEPSPDDYRALSFNVSQVQTLQSCVIHQTALWNDDSLELTFYLHSERADSSLIPINASTADIKVASARLDRVLEDEHYKLLKLEAEGAEPEILQGAVGVLDRFEYVSADLGFERGAEAASTLPEVTNFMLDHGFEICGYNGTRHCLLFRNKNFRKDT